MIRYWINTDGVPVVLYNLRTNSRKTLPNFPPKFNLVYKMKECSWLEYVLFRYTKINLKVKDKSRWLISYLRYKFYGDKDN